MRNNKPDKANQQPLDEEISQTLKRIECHIARLATVVDDGIREFINLKFPYGRPTDRWSRRG